MKSANNAPLPAGSVTGQARMRSIQSQERMETVVAFLAPFGLLAIWELLARTQILDPRFFPAPSAIVGTFYKLTFKVPSVCDSKPARILSSVVLPQPDGPTRTVN